jgi:hypothetical protein
MNFCLYKLHKQIFASTKFLLQHKFQQSKTAVSFRFLISIAAYISKSVKDDEQDYDESFCGGLF